MSVPLFKRKPKDFVGRCVLCRTSCSTECPSSELLGITSGITCPCGRTLRVLIRCKVIKVLTMVYTLTTVFQATQGVTSLTPFVMVLLFSLFSCPDCGLNLLMLFPVATNVSNGGVRLAEESHIVLYTVLSTFLKLSYSDVVGERASSHLLILSYCPNGVARRLVPRLHPAYRG